MSPLPCIVTIDAMGLCYKVSSQGLIAKDHAIGQDWSEGKNGLTRVRGSTSSFKHSVRSRDRENYEHWQSELLDAHVMIRSVPHFVAG
jgi:hypothetical protein